LAIFSADHPAVVRPCPEICRAYQFPVHSAFEVGEDDDFRLLLERCARSSSPEKESGPPKAIGINVDIFLFISTTLARKIHNLILKNLCYLLFLLHK
jgi:hypothetical protein